MPNSTSIGKTNDCTPVPSLSIETLGQALWWLENFARKAGYARRARSFATKLVEDPRQVYAEELRKAKPGQEIPDGVEIRIAVEDENVFYVVLPCIPENMQLSDETPEKVSKYQMTHRNPCWGVGDASQ